MVASRRARPAASTEVESMTVDVLLGCFVFGSLVSSTAFAMHRYEASELLYMCLLAHHNTKSCPKISSLSYIHTWRSTLGVDVFRRWNTSVYYHILYGIITLGFTLGGFII